MATPSRKTPPLLGAVLLAVSLAYPIVVYLALGHVSPRWIALLLVALALRARPSRARRSGWWPRRWRACSRSPAHWAIAGDR